MKQLIAIQPAYIIYTYAPSTVTQKRSPLKELHKHASLPPFNILVDLKVQQPLQNEQAVQRGGAVVLESGAFLCGV